MTSRVPKLQASYSCYLCTCEIGDWFTDRNAVNGYVHISATRFSPPLVQQFGYQECLRQYLNFMSTLYPFLYITLCSRCSLITAVPLRDLTYIFINFLLVIVTEMLVAWVTCNHEGLLESPCWIQQCFMLQGLFTSTQTSLCSVCSHVLKWFFSS